MASNRRSERTDAWFDDPPRRARFESRARELYPHMRARVRAACGRCRQRRAVTYELTMDVPCFDEVREVRIVFAHRRLCGPRAYAADPAGDAALARPYEPQHRYADGALCMWHPDAPVEERWTARDGLVGLLDAVSVHLFREHYHREHGRWPGPELQHGDHLLAA